MRAGVDVVLALCVVVLMTPQALATERWVPSQYPTIQSAIDACVDGDEVIVEPNTYTGDGNRDLDPNGKGITVRSTEPNDPNVVAATIIDCEGDAYNPHRGFLFHSDEDANSVVAGLTITNGRADYGGGIFCFESSPTITRCVITGNVAYTTMNLGLGGGVFLGGSDPKITHCTIGGNSAYQGGGICALGQVTIAHCTISQNVADDGGGLFCQGDSTLIMNCTIAGNSAGASGDHGEGGGIWCEDYSTLIMNCTITGNTASDYGEGGGIWITSVSSTIANSTVTANTSDRDGGGIYVADGGDPMAINCVLWGNTAAEHGHEIYLEHEASTITVLYSDVEGGPNAVYVCQQCALFGDPNTNIDADPLFVDPNGPDGDPNTWQDNDYHLSGGSPCINAGDPNGDYTGQTDIDGEPRVMLGRVDMGSDEYPGYTLTLKLKDPGPSVVEIEPNDPNWPAFAYPPGTELTLTAVPGGDKSFNKWKVWDAVDPNIITIDTNNPISIVMSADRKVKAVFKCGGGIEQAVPLLMVFGLLVVLGRRR